MKENKIGIERIVQVLILLLSVASIALGLFLAIAFMISILFCDNNNFCGHIFNEADIKLIGTLIVGGLLGSVLDFVLKKIMKDYIDKYLDRESVYLITQKLIAELILEKVKEEETAAEVEKSKPSDLDTVIVPVAKSYDDVFTNNEYVYPSERTFTKPVQYIAFYKEMKILGVAKVKEEINQGNLKIFSLENIKPLKIPHLGKGAFVQNKMYCNYQLLIKAKNTSEIKN